MEIFSHLRGCLLVAIFSVPENTAFHQFFGEYFFSWRVGKLTSRSDERKHYVIVFTGHEIASKTKCQNKKKVGGKVFFQLNILIIDNKNLQRMDAEETFEWLIYHWSDLEESFAI